MEKLSKSEAFEYLRKELLKVCKDLTKVWDPVPKRPDAGGDSGYNYRPGSIQSGRKELNLGNLVTPKKPDQFNSFHTYTNPKTKNARYPNPLVPNTFVNITHDQNAAGGRKKYMATFLSHYWRRMHEEPFFLEEDPSKPLYHPSQLPPEITDIVNQHHQNQLKEWKQSQDPTVNRFKHVANEMEGNAGEQAYIPQNGEFGEWLAQNHAKEIPLTNTNAHIQYDDQYHAYNILHRPSGSQWVYDITHGGPKINGEVSPTLHRPDIDQAVKAHHQNLQNQFQSQNTQQPYNRQIELE